jgi:hypothetical protein
MTLVAALLTSPPLVRGDEPHLEFARGLRARGLPDLALEYLQKLNQKPPADIAAILPLEIAKTRLEIGATDPDTGRRTTTQNQAKRDLEAFIQAQPKHPLAAEAAFEVARITLLQGQSELSRARQLDAKDAQHQAMTKARHRFEEAGAELQTAAARIQAQLNALESQGTSQAEADRKSLLQAKLRADLDQGIGLIRQAQTYIEPGEEGKRSELLKRASESLGKLAAQRDTLQDPLCWQALAWAGYCQLENEDPKAARKTLSDLIADTSEPAENGRRLARYFRMLVYPRDTDRGNPYGLVQQAGEEWLRLYPEQAHTPEGCGVRFELANAYLNQATAMPKAQQQSQRARAFYEKALRAFQTLEQTENEYTARAHQNKLNIILTTSQERTAGDISKLKDFQECYLRAQLEVAQLNQTGKKSDTAKPEQERDQRYKNMVLALTRALELADAGVSDDDLNDARFMLAYAYLVLQDYYRAAVWGEELARTQPKFARAALAGAYALRAYALVMSKAEEAGAGRDDVAADRERMRSLAHYIEQTWPGDSAADIARHTLGILLLADKNYPAAVETLGRITPAYSDSTRALYQLASAATQADKEEIKPGAGRPSYREQAEAALLRIPDLSGSDDPGTAQIYFAGKLMLADLYYRGKQYEKLRALADALAKALDNAADKIKAEHRINVRVLKLYADLGRAEAEYIAGHYSKASELVDPLVSAMKDPAHAVETNEVKEKDPGLVRAIVGLALRADVQDAKMARAKDMLEFLQKTFPDDALKILIQFVQQLNSQVQQLRDRGEPAKKDLERTVANFSAFLGELSKQQEKNPKPELLLFLVSSYSSLGEHKTAAKLAEQIPEPKLVAGKETTDPKVVQSYHLSRILQVRELRLAKDFAAAESTLKWILATPWGQNNLEVRKERVLLLEDQEKFAGTDGAVLGWNNLMQTLKPRLGDNKVKEQYFDCYYHLTWCLYQHALKAVNVQQKAKGIRSAAAMIERLEAQADAASDPARKKLTELLKKEPLLKQAYDKLKRPS